MTKHPETITVLVSLYGDSPYLKAFLDSLSEQSFQDFRLLYRFDGTPSDAVRSLIRQYSFAEGIEDESHRGIPGTYWELMLHASGGTYLMFADQDDVWHPDKIEKSLAEIRKMETHCGKETPILVHSDLTVINAGGKQLDHSFFHYQSLNYRRNSLKDLMIQNNITGCTMIFNRALAKYLRTPVPAICHDWYMALIAAAFGKISFINEALIDYRQHEQNYFGAYPAIRILKYNFSRKILQKRLTLTQEQARLFMEEHRARLKPEQIVILDMWGNVMPRVSYLKRLTIAFRFCFRKNDRLRTLGMWWAL